MKGESQKGVLVIALLFTQCSSLAAAWKSTGCALWWLSAYHSPSVTVRQVLSLPSLSRQMSIVCGGSYRRGRLTVGDMDLILTHADGHRSDKRTGCAPCTHMDLSCGTINRKPWSLMSVGHEPV